MRRSERRATRRVVLALLAVVLIAAAPEAQAAEAVLYRIFLRDGTTIVSYGDYARLDDRVVLSIPIGGLGTDSPELQLVSLPEAHVDWERTREYAEAARARHYADTRGEAEFARLSEQVADALHTVALTRDPLRRLEIVDSARRLLADWPASNYGYRARDVAQLLTLLDEVVTELRVAAGQGRFDLALVAGTSAPPPVTLMTTPAFQEQIQHALAAARLTPEPSERISLLEAIIRAVMSSRHEPWAAAVHSMASAELADELRIEKAYVDLRVRILADAERRARSADVKGIESLIRKALAEDEKLGRRRAQAAAVLLATLDARMQDARRLRLARDAWATRQAALREYERRIRRTMDQFRRWADGLEQIRQLAGPSPRALDRLVERAGTAGRDLALVRPPSGTEGVHTLLMSALQMALRAGMARHTAIQTTNMDAAWHASSAAAGALLMFERATAELQKLAIKPGS